MRRIVPIIAILMMTQGGLLTEARNRVAKDFKSPVKKSLQAKQARVLTLSFPKRSVGGLYLTHLDEEGHVGVPKEVSVARDIVKIEIPPDQSLLFKSNAAFMQAPLVLDAIPPDAIDIIHIKYAPLDEVEDKCGDDALKYVAKQTALKELFLEQFMASDQGLAYLANLKQLKFLKSEVGSANGACLKSLAGLPELIDLNLSFNPLIAENFKYLARFPKLKRLILHHCKINDQALTNIAKCTTIDDLSLVQNQLVKDSSIKSILQLKNLRTLDLRETGVTVEGVKQLKGLMKLKSLNISARAMPTAQLPAVRKMMPQTTITVEPGDRSVDDDTRRIFAPLPKGRI